MLLRIIFKRKDFASSDFFKLILLSRDIVLLLERVYVMSTNQGEFANSLLEVSELEACAILNNAKSNCVNVQCRMLKELIEVDRRVRRGKYRMRCRRSHISTNGRLRTSTCS